MIGRLRLGLRVAAAALAALYVGMAAGEALSVAVSNGPVSLPI